MKNEISPLVSIICTAYNHENYIKGALEGFVNQNTNFPFEIIVHDDASSDNTASLIREYEIKYPNLFIAIYQTENQYSKGNGDVGKIIFGAAKGKYIAICEGDDYWTDPFKLQKQVDFLECNIEFGAVFTDADLLYESSGKIIKNYDKQFNRKVPTGNVFDILLYDNPYKTCTSLFRKSLLENMNYTFLIDNKFQLGDKIIWLHIAMNSKIGYFPQTTSVYRVLSTSASHFEKIEDLKLFHENSLLISKLFAKNYNISFSEAYYRNLINKSILTKLVESGNYLEALMFIKNPFKLISIIIKEKVLRKIFLIIKTQ